MAQRSCSAFRWSCLLGLSSGKFMICVTTLKVMLSYFLKRHCWWFSWIFCNAYSKRRRFRLLLLVIVFPLANANFVRHSYLLVGNFLLSYCAAVVSMWLGSWLHICFRAYMGRDETGQSCTLLAFLIFFVFCTWRTWGESFKSAEHEHLLKAWLITIWWLKGWRRL